jgi:uncharacterized protein YndB with AHSA1/START domain
VTDDPIIRSVEIDAPPEAVFPLLVEADALVHWWPDLAELEPRIGGRVRMEFRGGESVVTGEVIRFEPPRALGLTWVREERPETTTRIELTVTPLDGERSRVDVVHSGWEQAPDLRAMHDQGWAHFLDCLSAFAENRPFDKSFRPTS